jgi:MFS family permease
MFAPAPLTGWLTDRLGSPAVALAGAGLLVLARALTAAAGADALILAIALASLGVGWNASLVAGSALLASAVPVAHRPRAEGVGELSMGVSAATGAAMAGPVVGLAGYASLAVLGATVAAVLGPLLVAFTRRSLPADAAPAPRMVT